MRHSKWFHNHPETFTVSEVSPAAAVPKPWWRRFAVELTLGTALIAMMIWGGNLYLRMRALTVRQELVSLYATDTQRRPKAVRLFIQNRLDVAIREATPTANHWTIAQESASHLAQSANPGESGNIIIYGHPGSAVLGPIKAITIGTTITLVSEYNIAHDYQVTAIIQTDPDHLEPLLPTTQEQLTLYTAAGLFGTKRLIIQAKPVIPAISIDTNSSL